MSWRETPIPAEQAGAIYDILVRDAGAQPAMRNDFIRAQDEGCVEYRFCGSLGFGGKFWNNNDRWYINYYPENRTDQRDAAEARINAQLEVLQYGLPTCDLCHELIGDTPHEVIRMMSGPRKWAHQSCLEDLRDDVRRTAR